MFYFCIFRHDNKIATVCKRFIYKHIVSRSNNQRWEMDEQFMKLCNHFDAILCTDTQTELSSKIEKYLHTDHVKALIRRLAPYLPTPSPNYENILRTWDQTDAHGRKIQIYILFILFIYSIVDKMYREEYGYTYRMNPVVINRHYRTECQLDGFQRYFSTISKILYLSWWLYENSSKVTPVGSIMAYRYLVGMSNCQMNNRARGELGHINPRISAIIESTEKHEIIFDAPSSYVRVQRALGVLIQRMGTPEDHITIPGINDHQVLYEIAQALYKELHRYRNIPNFY